ncbi:MAG: hypothetical protein OEY22_04675 [Candidatus Bathyarchaeota archaeon]|nr:hypothetical protein [Candidatus Bathyarchaeota archaeon]MDH5787425.1 hypothetical protein [Candidatus Bathyarchaeota archaeon]
MVWYSKLWVKISLVVIAVGLVVGGTYAYYWFSQPPAGPKALITSDPLEFSVELDKSDYQYGENITVKFRLENFGNETVTLMIINPIGWPDDYRETVYSNANFTSGFGAELFCGFSIADINGTQIYKYTEGILPYITYFNIDPGGWIEHTLIIDYYSIEWAGMGNSYLLPRGTYQIRGIMRYSLSGQSYGLETPSITFTIR